MPTWAHVTIGCCGGGGGDTDIGALGAAETGEEEMPFCDVGRWELDTGELGEVEEAWAKEDDLEPVRGATTGAGFDDGRTTISVVG